jgi:hypothetical protein
MAKIISVEPFKGPNMKNNRYNQSGRDEACFFGMCFGLGGMFEK